MFWLNLNPCCAGFIKVATGFNLWRYVLVEFKPAQAGFVYVAIGFNLWLLKKPQVKTYGAMFWLNLNPRRRVLSR